MTLKTITSIAFASIIVAGVAAPVLAETALTGTDAIAKRQELMKNNGRMLRTAKGATGDAAVAAARSLVDDFTMLPNLFPEDSKEVHETQALPAIWSDTTGFKAALGNPLYSTPQFAYANSGFCYINQGDGKHAKAAFEHALQVAPGFASALYGLARLSADAGDWKHADKYLNRVQGQAHFSPAVLALCMKVKQHLGDLMGATQCARDLYRMFPNSPEAKALQNGGS